MTMAPDNGRDAYWDYPQPHEEEKFYMTKIYDHLAQARALSEYVQPDGSIVPIDSELYSVPTPVAPAVYPFSVTHRVGFMPLPIPGFLVKLFPNYFGK